jgi:GNAT superfamily N-acetyltransferase
MTPPDDLRIRPMTPSDLPDGIRLVAAAGWNQTAGDWRLFLSAGRAFAAESGGRVVGTAALIVYGRMAWVGMVLVDPERRRMGIGRRLMERALEAAAGIACVKLDATPDGKPVYDRLGFRDEFGLRRMTALPSAVFDDRPGAVDLRPMAPADQDAVFALDRTVFGADRSAVLGSCLARAPEAAWMAPGGSGGAPRGYCFGRPGAKFFHLGPVVADSADAAAALARAALRASGPAVVDVPVTQSAFLDALGAWGFREQRPFIRMFRGENASPGLRERVFAAGGPEFG